NSEPAVCLHQANQAQDRVRSHEAVGIQRNRQLVVAAPPVAKITNIAWLVSGMHGASRVGRRDTTLPSRGELTDARFFQRRNRRVTGVAQQIAGEARSKATRAP